MASQHWRYFHGHGMQNLSPSMLLAKSESSAREGLVRSKRYRHTSFSSNLMGQDSKLQPQPKTQQKEFDQTGFNSNQKSISINKTIVLLGKDGRWKEILTLYQDQKQHFNAINHATVMSQLGRIRQIKKEDPLFGAFLADLNTNLHTHGIKWMGGVREVANIVHAIGKVGLPQTSNGSALNILRLAGDAEAAEWLFDNGKQQEIANCVWAFGALGIKSPNLFRLLDQRAEWLFENRSTQTFSNCVWACGKLGIKSQNLFRLLDERSEWFVGEASPQCLANCVWACAKLQIASPNLFRLLDERAEWLFEHGSSQNIVNCVWACGTLGIESQKLFSILDQRAGLLFEQASPQEIANSVWACGKLGIKSANLFRLLDERAGWLVKNGTPQILANCVWACGSLGIRSPKLFKLLDERCIWLIRNGTPRDLASCAWACGALGIVLPELFRSLDQRAMWLVESGTPQDLSNTLWATATLQIESPNLFRLLDKHAEWLVENGTPQEIVNCVWACGKLGVKAIKLLGLLDQRAEWLVDNGGAQSLANSVWACSKVEIELPNLLRLLDERAEWMIENGTSQEIANCAWALSVVGSQSPAFFTALDKSLDRFLVDANPQHLCNVCYAIAVININVLPQSGSLAEARNSLVGQESDLAFSVSNESSMLTKVWNCLVTRTIAELPVEELRQILYVQACASAYGVELACPSLLLQMQLDKVPLASLSSDFEIMVSKTLLNIGFFHERQVSPFQFAPGLLAIDLACPNRMIAIECDGPSHYVSLIGDVENQVEKGSTKAKRRLLRQLGWNVINLNWAEARQHRGSQEWVRGKLTEAGVVL